MTLVAKMRLEARLQIWGEDICDGVAREVEEETGIVADFVELLSFSSYEIVEQKSEILEAKKNCEEDYLGFSTVETTTGTGKKSFVYCNADHAMSLNAARDQASSSH
ncbi:hypothetical protein F2Q68_00030569 [Brassica cretica]|uniref:Nudix hydrolase domain-containing protein n=1 Tax=Brassica cretica TaxID=69181 RepID=A0A8S9GA49_BRACR|nr:hypothetical protein F2Q68_00030569 [Brassica cretica]